MARAADGIGFIATDRILMLPGGRIITQAVHRAVSFGAVGFLAIHIVVEVIAGRSQVDDSVVPFLDHGRTLYLGLGTVSSDLFVLIIVTGILRGRFVTVRPAWMWRALHVTAYAAWPLAILHGLLAGRTARAGEAATSPTPPARSSAPQASPRHRFASHTPRNPVCTHGRTRFSLRPSSVAGRCLHSGTAHSIQS